MDRTTQALRGAAIEELLAVGQASMTIDGVARRAHAAVGTVYLRWSGRAALLADLLDALAAPGLKDPRELQLTAELAMAARERDHDPAYELLRDGVARYVASAAATAGLDPDGPGWYALASLLGTAMLRTAGCTVPPIEARIVEVVGLAAATATGAAPATGPRPATDPGTGGLPEVPGLSALPAPDIADPTTTALVQSARKRIAQDGVSRAALRRIAEEAGVTTGAIYRRYASKSELVEDLLVQELSGRRDEITGLLVQGLATGAPNPGDVIFEELSRVLQDDALRRLYLEAVVASRLDPGTRTTFANRVCEAVAVRTAGFAALRASGLLAATADPEVLAWLMQASPAGARLLADLEIEPHPDGLRGFLRALVAWSQGLA